MKNTKMIRQYIVGECIGEGSYGKVREAVDSKTGKRCAIKILKKRNLLKVPGGESHVRREIEILKKLHHPNCISLIEEFEDEEKDKIYIVCEYVSGGSLQSLLNKAPNKRLPAAQARSLFKQLVNALEYIHGIGIIHSGNSSLDNLLLINVDIKPDNILLTVDGVLKLSDFGVAHCSKSKECNGSPAFRPPEITSGVANSCGPNVDIWAAGITLFIMVTGKFPFEGNNVCSLMKNIGGGVYSIPDWIDESLSDLLRSMLQTDHTKRTTLQQLKHHPWMSAKLKQQSFVSIPGHSTAFSRVPSKNPIPSCSCTIS